MKPIPISHRLLAFLLVGAAVFGAASIANALPVSGRDLAQSIICKVFGDLQARGLYNRSLAARCNIIPPPTTAKLIVIKNVQGSTTTPSAFTLQVVSGSSTTTFSGNASGTILTFPGNSAFTVAESPATDFSPSFSSGCSGTLLPNSTTTCTVMNTFTGTTTPTTTPSSLKIIKIVQDGTATSSDFQIHVKSATTSLDIAGSPQPGSATGTTYSGLASSTYIVSETGPGDHSVTFSGACAGTSTIVLAGSTTVTCTITNTFVGTTSSITVTKIVQGGSATSSDFSIHVHKVEGVNLIDVAGSPQPGTASGTTYGGLFAGTYHIAETGGPSDYSLSYSGNCDTNGFIVLASSTSATCTLTNTFTETTTPTTTPSTLTIIKMVEGGTATPSDFLVYVKENNVDIAGSPQAGSSTGTIYGNLASSTYVVSETGPADYNAAFSGACSGTSTIMLVCRTTVTCTITNTFTGTTTPTTTPKPDLTVFKIVQGTTTATSSNYQIHVKSATTTLDVTGSPQPGSEAGTTYSLSFGDYVVSETGDPEADDIVFSGACDANGQVNLSSTTTASCTITNVFNEP